MLGLGSCSFVHGLCVGDAVVKVYNHQACRLGYKGGISAEKNLQKGDNQLAGFSCAEAVVLVTAVL